MTEPTSNNSQSDVSSDQSCTVCGLPRPAAERGECNVPGCVYHRGHTGDHGISFDRVATDLAALDSTTDD